MTSYADYRPDVQYQPNVAVAPVALSPDGTRVAYVDNRTGRYNLVVQPFDGGPARRLTDFTGDAVWGLTWTPDGRTLVFLADTHGDEAFQLRRISADGGEITPLTKAPRAQHFLGQVSPDGRWIAYSGNDLEPSREDALVQDLGTGEVRRVYDRAAPPPWPAGPRRAPASS